MQNSGATDEERPVDKRGMKGAEWRSSDLVWTEVWPDLVL